MATTLNYLVVSNLTNQNIDVSRETSWLDDPTWNFFVTVIVRFIFPFPVIISLVANICSFLTILRHRESFPKTTRLHMLVIISNDILFLVVKCPLFYFHLNENIKPENRMAIWRDPGQFGITVCMLYTLFTYYCHPGMSFFQLGLTIDRVIAVVWPLRSKRMLNGKNTLCLIGVLLAIGLSFPVFIVNVVGLDRQPDDSGTNKTVTYCDTLESKGKLYTIYTAYEFIMNSLLAGCLIAGSAIILFKLCQSIKKLNITSSSEESTSRRRNSTIRLSVMLLLMNFMYLISYLPFSIYQFIFNQDLVHKTNEYTLIFGYLNSMNYINSCVHWISYFVGENFRHCFYNTIGIDKLTVCKNGPSPQHHSLHCSGQQEMRRTTSCWDKRRNQLYFTPITNETQQTPL